MSVLRVENIVKEVGEGSAKQSVLAGADLSLTAGEFVTILGPSGSGKSTFLNICGLLERPDSGGIYFKDQLLGKYTRQQTAQFRRRHLGFVFQSFNLVPVMTVYDNVAYPLMLLNLKKTQVHDQVMPILQQVGLEQHVNKKPGQLSGGQCQRVAIARALVKQPELIIADEPTASLDGQSALKIIELMKSLAKKQGSACLIATHDQRILEFSDRVFEVDRGMLVAKNHLREQTKKGVAA